jgi:hypothetical protein
VRNASLAKGGTSKKRPSLYLHKVPTGSNKMSPRTLRTALVYYRPGGIYDLFHDFQVMAIEERKKEPFCV